MEQEQEQGYGDDDRLQNTRHFSRINAPDEMRNSEKYGGQIGDLYKAGKP